MDVFEKALESVLSKLALGFDLGSEQVECLKNVVEGRHVICVLPTGFGKSVCYALAPLIRSEMCGDAKVALVISPLIALMKNQVDQMAQMGISAVHVHKGMTDAEHESLRMCSKSLYFASPEVLQGQHWVRMLTTPPWSQRLCLVACDEAHCISEWGDDFRPMYKEVHILRSLAPRGCSFLALTATATTKVVADIKTELMLVNPHEIVRQPNRPNIHITIKTGKKLKLEELLAPTLVNLRDQKYDADKTIIYCRSITSVSNVYEYLFEALGKSLFPSGDKSKAEDRLIDMFHAEVGGNATKRIIQNFVIPSCRLRCLVSTIAFGMGMQIPNVRVVLHWGCSKSILSYWQEVGRAGRDSKPARVVLYANGKSVGDPNRTGQDMREFCRKVEANRVEGTHLCLRKCLLEYFYTAASGDIQEDVPDCSVACCSTCDHKIHQTQNASPENN